MFDGLEWSRGPELPITSRRCMALAIDEDRFMVQPGKTGYLQGKRPRTVTREDANRVLIGLTSNLVPFRTFVRRG